MSKAAPDIEALERRHKRDRFSCGVPALDEVLKRYALQNQRDNLSRTFVLTDDASHVVGYYTVAASSVGRETVPDQFRLPKYPIPTVLLARLAVDECHKGERIG